MEASICSQEKTVGLYFVRPAEGASSPCLLAAYQACERFKSKWISAAECLQMSPTKQDVFVCDPFEGKAFAHLTSGFKCVVVGPRCILSCLHRTEPIPQLPSPIHNTAMRGLVITTTGFERARKEELKSMVERMAGIYSSDYHMGVTHLVANEVGTRKYQVAVEQEIPIMTGEWVSAVWNAVAKDHTQHILATDERFLSHACPVLYGMVVCVSQLDRPTKLALQGIIEENGGTYSPMLEMSKTSVLIVSAPEGEKYTHACKWRIKCLTPDWVYDSVQRGHALQMENYEVKKQKHSTPNHSRHTSMLPAEVSQCSAIIGDRTASVDETLEMKEAASKERRSSFSKEVNLGLEAVESLDLQDAQKAGLFLDGCKVFLSGFSNNHLEKLRRVLNFGGATRFNQLTEAVSHVVIGKPAEEHLGLVRGWSTRPHLVYAHWITESIKLRRPAEEGQFAHPVEEEMVVENVQKAQHTTPTTTSTTSTTSSVHNTSGAQCNGEVPLEDEVLRQYLKPGQADANTSAAASVGSSGAALSDPQDRRASKPFSNKKFTVSGYSPDMEETLIEVVEEHGGRIVPLDHQGPVQYSLITSEGSCHPQAEEVVSHYFLEDCATAKRLVPVEYYHVPLMPPEDTFPLEDCCITISTYTKSERAFLENLTVLLGARSQDMFAKKPNPEKNVVPSTHLVCPLPSGNKYKAAKKWGVPAVSADWLVECARVTRRVSEDPFLVDCSNKKKVDKKKVFKHHLAVTLERRQVEEAGQEATSPSHRRNDRSGSCTPSPNKLHQSVTTAEVHSSPQISRSQKDTSRNSPPHRTRKKLKLLNDSFPTPTLSQDPTKETPAKEFYKKFYEDIKETMKKYKRKPHLQLQDSGITKASSQKGRDTEMESQREQEEKEKQSEGPLKGVVVCASRKFVDQWKEMSAVVERLGGQYLSSYGPEVTHFLFQGRPNDLNREFRKAKQDGKVVVAPDWLWTCQEKGTRVDELLFPHTHNPNMSLPLVGSSPNKAKRKYPEEEQEEREHLQQQNETDNSEGNKEKDETQEERERLSKQLEEIGALAQLSGRRNNGTRGRSKPIGEWHRHPSSRHVDIETQPMSGEEPESQGTAITWEDPREREARIRLQNQLNGSIQDQVCTEETDEDMKEVEEANKTHKEEKAALPVSDETIASVPKSPDTQQLVFVLVGMSEEKRQRYSKVVEELGAAVTLCPTFNPDITHLVAESLSRSERTLAAIASGKWVLHDSYLDHSHQAGHFLKEELYAWGNPAAEHLPILPPEITRAQLAKAAWRWRVAISDLGGSAGQRPFHNMVALVHSTKDRTGAFSRMIKAGGGEVVEAKPPYRELEGITHFFAELDKAPENVDLEAFVAKGIPCLKPIYINNYLIMDPLPEEEDHYISQYRDLLVSMSGQNQSGTKRLRRE